MYGNCSKIKKKTFEGYVRLYSNVKTSLIMKRVYCLCGLEAGVRFQVSVHLLVSWSRWLCKWSAGWATKWTAVSSGPRFYGRQSAARLITHYLSPLHFTWLCICISQVTHGPICIPGILPLRHWRSGLLAPVSHSSCPGFKCSLEIRDTGD